VTDKPSPLKLIEPADTKTLTDRFTGTVEISGRFSVGWVSPDFLQVLFFPDAGSAAVLPHERRRRPVEVLHVSNSEQAARLLLDAATAQKILAKELQTAQGAATVTIRDYETSVSCDTRGYSAELVAASRNAIVVAARDERRFGC